MNILQSADELQRLTYDLAHYYNLCDRYTTQKLGITGAQGYILLAIPENSQISMNDLSIKMRLANSTMTRMVDQLVQKGMVTRESDHHDRRIVLVQLTDQGTNVRKKFKEALQSLFSQVLGEILETERMDILKSLSVFNDAIIKTLKSCCEEDML